MRFASGSWTCGIDVSRDHAGTELSYDSSVCNAEGGNRGGKNGSSVSHLWALGGCRRRLWNIGRIRRGCCPCATRNRPFASDGTDRGCERGSPRWNTGRVYPVSPSSDALASSSSKASPSSSPRSSAPRVPRASRQVGASGEALPLGLDLSRFPNEASRPRAYIRHRGRGATTLK